jgi:hypothetical protein
MKPARSERSAEPRVPDRSTEPRVSDRSAEPWVLERPHAMALLAYGITHETYSTSSPGNWSIEVKISSAPADSRVSAL